LQDTSPAEFVPINPLESELIQAMDGKVSTEAFLKVFIASDIAIPTATEVAADGSGMSPLFYIKRGKK